MIINYSKFVVFYFFRFRGIRRLLKYSILVKKYFQSVDSKASGSSGKKNRTIDRVFALFRLIFKSSFRFSAERKVKILIWKRRLFLYYIYVYFFCRVQIKQRTSDYYVLSKFPLRIENVVLDWFSILRKNLQALRAIYEVF